MKSKFKNSNIYSGRGGRGRNARGGDTASHNKVTNSHNVHNSTVNFNFHGSQFITNPSTNVLDLSLQSNDGKPALVTAYPFHGGINQRWNFIPRFPGSRKYALQSDYDNSYVGIGGIPREEAELIAVEEPVYWIIEPNDQGSFQLFAPGTNRKLALGLDPDVVKLHPPEDKSTLLNVVPDNPENRVALEKGKVPSMRQPGTTSQVSSSGIPERQWPSNVPSSKRPPASTPLPAHGGNLNIFITNSPEYSSPEDIKSPGAPRIFSLSTFNQNKDKNLVIFNGQSHEGNYRHSNPGGRINDPGDDSRGEIVVEGGRKKPIFEFPFKLQSSGGNKKKITSFIQHPISIDLNGSLTILACLTSIDKYVEDTDWRTLIAIDSPDCKTSLLKVCFPPKSMIIDFSYTLDTHEPVDELTGVTVENVSFHFALTLSGGIVAVYLDGEEKWTHNIEHLLFDPRNKHLVLGISKCDNKPTAQWNGDISEVVVFDEVLEEEEVMAEFQKVQKNVKLG